MKRRWSIRTQLLLLALAIFVPLGALGAVTLYTDLRVTAARAEDSVLSLAEVTAANLRQFLTDTESTLLDFASRDGVRGMTPDACDGGLRELRVLLPHYSNFFVADVQGRLVCSARPIPGALEGPLVDAEWFPAALDSGGVATGKPRLDPVSGDWSAVLARAVRDPAGDVVGILAVSIDLIRFQELLAGPTLPPGAVITIDDLDGIVVARSVHPEEWVGRELPPVDGPPGSLARPRGVTRARGAEGTDRLWGFAAVPGSEWRVWAGVPTDWVYAPVREAAVRKGVVGLAVLLLAGILAGSMYRRISSSLESLVEGTRLAALGRPEAIALAGPAEVVQVAEQFARTLEARDQAEAEQRALLARYDRVVRATNDAVWDWDLTTGLIVWNENLATYFGHSPEELAGGPEAWASHIHPDDRDRVLAGVRSALDGDARTWHDEYRFRRADGDWAHVHDRGYVARDGSGRAIRMTGAMVDVTERRRAMGQLRRAQERYRSVVDNAVFGIYVATPEGRILEANPALAAMLGYDGPEDVAAIPVGTLFRVDEERSGFERVVAAGRPIEGFEAAWARADGSIVQVRLSGHPIRIDGGAVALEMIAEDVTERRLLEEQVRQAQKMEAVGRLAGGVAHDFNNLLTIVANEAHFLRAELPDAGPSVQEGTEQILAAAKRGAELTRQLLAFGRKQVLQPRIVDLNRVVADTEPMLRRLAGNGDDLRIALEPGLLNTRVDPVQVQQVLMNLVLNARDAMPGGGGIEIRTANVALDAAYARSRVDVRPGSFVELSVRDEGPGIPEAMQSRVFEPFFTTKPDGEGTGLGLSTVYGIAVQSGGHVELRSRPGAGSEFLVRFPATAEVADRENPTRTRRPPDLGGGGSETVLVAEDDGAVRRVVARTLRDAGYRVIEGADGEAALRAALGHEGPIDLVLADVVMPGSAGPELAERMRELRPDLRAAFMSGYPDHQAAQNGAPDPTQPVISKPFTPEALLAFVRAVLDGEGAAPSEKGAEGDASRPTSGSTA